MAFFDGSQQVVRLAERFVERRNLICLTNEVWPCHIKGQLPLFLEAPAKIFFAIFARLVWGDDQI